MYVTLKGADPDDCYSEPHNTQISSLFVFLSGIRHEDCKELTPVNMKPVMSERLVTSLKKIRSH